MGLLFTKNVRRNVDRSTTINYPSTINHIEKRAPTDESIKLYDEYLRKTEERILGVYELDNNLFKVVVVMFCVDMSFDQNVKYRFKTDINGNEEMFEFELDGFQMDKLRRMGEQGDKEILQMIYEKISKIFAFRFIQQVKTKELGLSKDYRI